MRQEGGVCERCVSRRCVRGASGGRCVRGASGGRCVRGASGGRCV